MTTAPTYTPTTYDTEYATFLAAYPEYRTTEHLDTIRARDHYALNSEGLIYLDHTGSALPGRTHLDTHHHWSSSHVFGNPHSASTPSRRATSAIHQARTDVLTHFNADPAVYDVIFTANATAAIRLVGEAFPFSPTRPFALLADNHNSVLGIREFARAALAPHHVIPLDPGSLRGDTIALSRALSGDTGLFAYPAQSNFSGVRHPLEWIVHAQRRGWEVLLDAAAYTPASHLDLSLHTPDFVALSWYKMFGWPTGLGALIARKDALARLRRPWFAGGTVTAASAYGDWHTLAPGPGRWEDGTPDFMGAHAVSVGLELHAEKTYDAIGTRLHCLGSWLLDRLATLRHSNGRPVCVLYGPENMHARGATFALNFVDPDGHLVDERVVEQAATRAGIALRTGCFCNPGAGETVFGLSSEALRRAGAARLGSVDDYLRELGLPTGGAVRVSLGSISEFADVYWFGVFAQGWRDRRVRADDVGPREHC